MPRAALRQPDGEPVMTRYAKAISQRTHWLVLVALGCLATPLFAQSARIQVEVLVFAYNTPEDGAALSADDPDPRYNGMLLGEAGGDYSKLPASSLKLGGAFTALARHARTRALVHIGWQQPVGSERGVRLRGTRSISGSDPERGLLASQEPEIDGDISLKFGRAVEAHVDLLLREVSSGGQQRRFRLNTRRIMTSNGEVHYLDHPAVGVIVSVTELSETAPIAP